MARGRGKALILSYIKSRKKLLKYQSLDLKELKMLKGKCFEMSGNEVEKILIRLRDNLREYKSLSYINLKSNQVFSEMRKLRIKIARDAAITWPLLSQQAKQYICSEIADIESL